jgi:hypothetical protein
MELTGCGGPFPFQAKTRSFLRLFYPRLIGLLLLFARESISAAPPGFVPGEIAFLDPTSQAE